jgi:hypothetical protein
MSMRSEISARPFIGSSKRTDKPGWRPISDLTINPDVIAITVFFAIGLSIALWLTVELPVPVLTAEFLARFG